MSNTTTSASLRTLLPASLADLRVTAYSPDILSNGIISEGEEVRNETARAMAVTTAATTTISTSLFAVAALCLNFLSCSRFTPVLLFIQTYQYCKLEPGLREIQNSMYDYKYEYIRMKKTGILNKKGQITHHSIKGAVLDWPC